MKNQKGITLIALVITIIVLIILAGVGIKFALGENGLVQRAQLTQEQTVKQAIKEEIERAVLDIQVEEVSKTGKLTLQKVYDELPITNTNIVFEEYDNVLDSELNGTYVKDGKEYTFTLDGDYKVSVLSIEKENPVKPSQMVWNEDGTVDIELLTKLPGTIEYQINGTTGVWGTGTEISDLQLGDIVYVRVTNGTAITETYEIEIKDTIAPEYFEIEVSEDSITYEAFKITTVGTTDNQTGLKNYSYVVAKKDGTTVKEIKEQTVTEYTIEGLEEKTEYIVYMIAYDNSGNRKRSNVVTVQTTVYIPPVVSNPSTASRTGSLLPFTWEELAEIAKTISNNDDTITSQISQFTLLYKGKEYIIGVGDYTTVMYNNTPYTVRILAFNHDTLTTPTIYENEDGRENITAGITFGFDNIIINKRMKSKDTSSGGWGGCEIRTTLNETIKINLSNNEHIKQIQKAYCANYSSTALSYSTDYLWLLSCSEIWNSKALGSGKEGARYKYYSLKAGAYTSNDTDLVKKYNGTATEWWLRTPFYNGAAFCTVNNRGMGGYAYSSKAWGVSPAFAI